MFEDQMLVIIPAFVGVRWRLFLLPGPTSGIKGQALSSATTIRFECDMAQDQKIIGF